MCNSGTIGHLIAHYEIVTARIADYSGNLIASRIVRKNTVLSVPIRINSIIENDFFYNSIVELFDNKILDIDVNILAGNNSEREKYTNQEDNCFFQERNGNSFHNKTLNKT